MFKCPDTYNTFVAAKRSNIGSKARSLATKAALAVGGLTAAAQSFATGPDFTTLSASIDWTSVVTGVLAAGVAAMTVVIAVKGTKYIVSAVKSF